MPATVTRFALNVRKDMLDNTQPIPSYPIVSFQDKSALITQKKSGFLVGRYLVISGSDNNWQVYSLHTGKPLLDCRFVGYKDAAAFASFCDRLFEEYLPLLELYPDADIFGICKWTVPNGIRVYEALQTVRRKVVGVEDINKAASEANVYGWTRGI